MTKRSVALVGVLVVMAMIGSSVIGAVSAWATSDAANGTYSVFLPLIMNAIGAMAEVPQGAVMTFNLTSCPSGWTEVTAAQGRAIVGLPSGGALNGEVGSGLSDLEDRTHTHDINPSSSSSTSAGSHLHSVNPPNATSTSNGGHYHWINTPLTSTSTNSHSHQWVHFGFLQRWSSWNEDGDYVSIMTWENGMDSAGGGHYPLSRSTNTPYKDYFTDETGHNHTIDIIDFTSDTVANHTHSTDVVPFNSGTSGTHSHSVDIPNTSSTTASTSDVMPYIQFLVCEKD